MDPQQLLSSITSRYQGEACWQRLLCVAAASSSSSNNNNSNPSLSIPAYRLLAQLLKQQHNTLLYKQVFSDKPDYWDAQWVTTTETTNRQQRDLLTSKLNHAQTHLNKDTIREAYLSLAEFYANIGEWNDAFHTLLRAKDYCMSRPQTIHVSLELLQAGLHLKHYSSVREYVNKLSHTVLGGRNNNNNNAATATATSIEPEQQQRILNQIAVASGLCFLQTLEFSKAAEQFQKVAMNNNNNSNNNSMLQWPTVLAAEEVAMYAAILALAVSPRPGMIALAEHVDALEMVPLLKECLLLFASRANYRQCWNILETSIFPILQQDVYMAPHVNVLKRLIQEKAILFYWKPLCRVPLATMAEELGSSLILACTADADASDNNNNNTTSTTTDHNHSLVAALTTIMVQLIRAGNKVSSDTRIHLQSQTLERQDVFPAIITVEKQRIEETQTKLSTVCERVLNDSYSMMIRMACLEHNLIVGGSGGGGGGTAMHTTATVSGAAGNKRANNTASNDGMALGAAAEAALSSDDDDDDNDDHLDDDDEYGIEEDRVMMMDIADDMNPEDLY